MPEPGLTLGERGFVWGMYPGRRLVAHLVELFGSGKTAYRALCGRYAFPVTSNVPWGRRRCWYCNKALERVSRDEASASRGSDA